MFRVGIHDAAEEGELDEMEAEVGVFRREASEDGKECIAMTSLGGMV